MDPVIPSEPLPQNPVARQRLVRSQRVRIAELEQRLAWFLVQYRLAQHRRFAASTETSGHQLDLFAELLAEIRPDDTAAAEPVAAPVTPDAPGDLAAAARGHGGRRPLPASLPRETIMHDLADDQKVCPCCGQPRAVIGEDRSEQLEIEPPRLKVIEHVRLKYACPACEHGGVQTAPKPPQPIPKSLASPGLLAWLVTAKIADELPLYRQEAIFRRLGIELPWNTLAAWLIRAGWLVQPLINLLHDELLARAILLADEIRLQVLREDGLAAQTDSWLLPQWPAPAPHSIRVRPMAIDIDQLTEAELMDLNRRIVERLRFLHQMRAHATMLKFSIGDRVMFETDDGQTVVGALVRYNKKTVSVLTDDGHRWNVSPRFLRSVEPRDITPSADAASKK